MPVIESCEPRSPPAVESPPRKRFKFSLKLKAKKKAKDKSPIESDSENESVAENGVSTANFEEKSSTNDLTAGESSLCNFFERGSETVAQPLPYSGLANLGNTCYLNAVLQVLRYCPGFLKSLQKLDEISGQDCTKFIAGDSAKSNASVSDEDSLPSTRPSILHSIHKLSNEMESAEKNYSMYGLEANEVKDRSGWTTLAVRPSDFVRDFSDLCPLFRGYQQHDAQEFLRSFLGLVEEECVGLVKSEQQDSMKGNNSIANNGDTKVRGGCKYPCTITSRVAMETKSESTKTMCTGDTTRIQHASEVTWSENGVSENLYATSPKAVQKDKVTCPDVGNVVKRLFEGTLLLQTCCLNCEGICQRHESFQDISVPVQNTKPDSNDEFGNNLSDSEDESDQDLNLSWAVSKFASVERLNGDNKYFCDNCATLTEADISTYFKKLPQVFTIHLKRFQTSYGNSSLYSGSWVTKVTKSLHTPQQLSLKKWCSKTCSDTDAVYSLFGVVMHNGMSSCSGHYLSYVNVDLLRKQADSGRKMNGNDRPSGAQCEAAGIEEQAMEVDGGFEKEVDECFSGGVTSKASAHTGQDRSVKCGSCLSKAKVGVTDETVCDLPQDDTSSVGDKEISCRGGGTVRDGSSPCETKCVELENRELWCEETLPMELENSCDYSESVKDPLKQTNFSTVQDSINDTQKFSTDKSDTQINRRYPLRSTRTDTMKNDHDSEDSSDDDEIAPDHCGHIPRSMDIKRYFKPTPKSKGPIKTSFKISKTEACFSETSSGSVNTSSNGKALDEGKNQDNSFSKTTDAAFDGRSLKKSLPKSQSSAFSTVETSCASSNTRSDRGSLNEESDRNYPYSQGKDASNNMQESRKSIQEPPSQGSACNGHTSSSKPQNGGSMVQDLEDLERLSCTERQDEAELEDARTDQCSESASSLKLMLDMEPSDELSETKGEFCVNTTHGVTSELHAPAQSTTNYGTGNNDSLAAKCSHSNQNANHVASHEGSTSHTSPKTNGCTLASRGKSSKCADTRDSSQIDCVNTSPSGSTWLKFDDAEVQEISGKDMDQILSQSTSCYSTPYLLFYYRC